eukprot:scaffold2771_cov252-Pinguiococcus_pyrenoidosus.AAC.5
MLVAAASGFITAKQIGEAGPHLGLLKHCIVLDEPATLAGSRVCLRSADCLASASVRQAENTTAGKPGLFS